MTKHTPIINLIIKSKIAKTRKQANVLMVVFCIICLIADIIILKSVA